MVGEDLAFERPLGGRPVPGGFRLRLWAPRAGSLSVQVHDGRGRGVGREIGGGDASA